MTDEEALDLLQQKDSVEVKLKFSIDDFTDLLQSDIYISDDVTLSLRLLFMYALDYIHKYSRGEVKNED